MKRAITPPAKAYPNYLHNPATPYYNGPDTMCPACTSSNWYVGRGDTVECTACQYPLVKAYRETQGLTPVLI